MSEPAGTPTSDIRVTPDFEEYLDDMGKLYLQGVDARDVDPEILRRFGGALALAARDASWLRNVERRWLKDPPREGEAFRRAVDSRWNEYVQRIYDRIREGDSQAKAVETVIRSRTNTWPQSKELVKILIPDSITVGGRRYPEWRGRIAVFSAESFRGLELLRSSPLVAAAALGHLYATAKDWENARPEEWERSLQAAETAGAVASVVSPLADAGVRAISGRSRLPASRSTAGQRSTEDARRSDLGTATSAADRSLSPPSGSRPSNRTSGPLRSGVSGRGRRSEGKGRRAPTRTGQGSAGRVSRVPPITPEQRKRMVSHGKQVEAYYERDVARKLSRDSDTIDEVAALLRRTRRERGEQTSVAVRAASGELSVLERILRNPLTVEVRALSPSTQKGARTADLEVVFRHSGVQRTQRIEIRTDTAAKRGERTPQRRSGAGDLRRTGPLTKRQFDSARLKDAILSKIKRGQLSQETPGVIVVKLTSNPPPGKPLLTPKQIQTIETRLRNHPEVTGVYVTYRRAGTRGWTVARIGSKESGLGIATEVLE